MIIKCPNCSSALEYEPSVNRMVCRFCDSNFNVTEFKNGIYIGENGNVMQKPLAEEKEPEPSETEEPDAFKADLSDKEMMDCSVYTCNSCGAELIVNDVEAATFCAYCGQPTVVFSRVSKTLKPEYIIPFVITRERAAQIVHQEIKWALFAPSDLKKLKMDRIRGIYIPYWVVDVDYETDQIWRSTVKDEYHQDHYIYYNRAAKAEFRDMTLCASERLNDKVVQRLEPYKMRSQKTFEIGYMQGFYADRYDFGRDIMYNLAKNRTMDLFNEEMQKTVHGKDVTLVDNRPDFELKKTSYVLLPVWFVNYRHEGVTHTLLINGQTGKITGGIPYQKSKVFLSILIISIICLIITAAIIQGYGSLAAILSFALIPCYGFAIINFSKAKKSVMQAKEADLVNLVRNRQEDETF